MPGNREVTFVSMTYNLWGKHHLDERKPALRALFSTRQPDLLAVQELTPESMSLLDEALPRHERVTDDFSGWSERSNLWWRTDLFSYVEHGVVDVGIREADSRLFWVRVRHRDDDAAGELVFSTGHLSWPGNTQERADGVNARTPQAAQIAAALTEVAGDDPCIFTVDINDIGEPLWTFGNAGFIDSFTALGAHSPPTHPVIPRPFEKDIATALSPVQSPQKAIDWQFFRGDLEARSSEVVEFFYEGHAPSDHKPVVATFTMPGGRLP